MSQFEDNFWGAGLHHLHQGSWCSSCVVGCWGCVSLLEFYLVTWFKSRFAAEWAPSTSKCIAEVALSTWRLDLSCFELLQTNIGLIEFLLATVAICAGFTWHYTVAVTSKCACHRFHCIFVLHQGVFVDLSAVAVESGPGIGCLWNRCFLDRCFFSVFEGGTSLLER